MPPKKANPYIDGYAIRNPFVRGMFRFLDALLEASGAGRSFRELKPTKILVSNLGHLGDVVAFAGILESIRKQYVGCRIDMLIGSWSKPVGELLVGTSNILCFDHILHNRSRRSVFVKVWIHYLTRAGALRKMRHEKYDVAIDFYWNFGNSVPLLWQARIESRIGYASGGFGGLLTHPLYLDDRIEAVEMRHFRLLRSAGFLDELCEDHEKVFSKKKFDKLPVSLSSILDPNTSPRDLVLVHSDTVATIREWPDASWEKLVGALVSDGRHVVFTGQGTTRRARVAEIIGGKSNCYNLVDLLNFQEFLAVVSFARLVISVDTVTIHFASAFGRPCVGLVTGMWPNLWRPSASNYLGLYKHLPCESCFRNNGCRTMDCIRGLTPDRVYAEVSSRLEARSLPSSSH